MPTTNRALSAALAWPMALACWAVFLASSVSAGHDKTGFPTGRLAVGVLSFAAGLSVLVRQARSQRPSGFGTTWRGLLRTRPRGPLALPGLCAFCGVAAVFLAVLTTAMHDSDARTTEVQHHGLRESGTVLDVLVTTRTRVSKNYGFRTRVTSTEVAVHLDQAVRGASQTTVHSPRAVALAVGAPVTVLVDPNDLTYAEFPGKPLHAAWGWIVLLVCSFALWALVVRTLMTEPRSRRAPRLGTA